MNDCNLDYKCSKTFKISFFYSIFALFCFSGQKFLRNVSEDFLTLFRLVARGHVPYYRMSSVLPGHMKFSKEDMSTFSYRPLIVKKIHDGTNFLMNYLDLPEIPAPNCFLLIAKLILDFQLPGKYLFS